MATEGGAKCIKIIVLSFNLLFFLFGCILVGIGVWAEVKLGAYFQLDALKDYGIDSAPRILIAVGCIIAVVSFFGCCGAWMESKIMLIVFFILLLLLLILECTAAALAFIKKDKIKDDLETEIKNKIKEYPQKNKQAIDDLQTKVKCCGAVMYTDWRLNTLYVSRGSVPDSCCTDPTKKGCGTGKLSRNTGGIYTEGCYVKVKGEVENNLIAVAAVAIAFLVIQVLGMAFAMILICRIEK